jgi:hypothetical protein
MTRKNGPNTDRDGAGRFIPGNAGRPPGAKNRATRAALALLEGEAEALTRKVVEVALDGDIGALRLCVERIAPPRRDTPVNFDLPQIQSANEAASAASAVLEATAAGALTPLEATRLMALIESYRRILELSALEARVTALESQFSAT